MRMTNRKRVTINRRKSHNKLTIHKLLGSAFFYYRLSRYVYRPKDKMRHMPEIRVKRVIFA